MGQERLMQMSRNFKSKAKEIDWIVREITDAREDGLFVVINGVYCENMEEVDNMLLIREEETYMKDYVGDEKGTIIGIAFDKIKITNY